MKQFACLLLAACFALPAKADKNTTPGWETWTHCLVPVKQEWTKTCNDNLFIQWQNNCGEPMDIKYAFQRTDGKWVTGVVWNIKPGETKGGSACTANGKYYLWGRPTSQSSQVKFPSDEQIKSGNIPGPNKTAESPAAPAKPTAANATANCNADLPYILISETGDYYVKASDGCYLKITPSQYANYKQLKTAEEKRIWRQNCNPRPERTIPAYPLQGN